MNKKSDKNSKFSTKIRNFGIQEQNVSKNEYLSQNLQLTLNWAVCRLSQKADLTIKGAVPKNRFGSFLVDV